MSTVIDIKDALNHAVTPMQQPVEVYLVHANGSQDKVVTGYINGMADSLSEGDHEVSYVGRGLCQDIVDCSCEFYGTKAKELLNLSVSAAVAKIAQPYGINLSVQAPLSETPFVGVIGMNIGDTAYSAVEYLARVSGCLLYENEKGELVLGSPASEAASTMVLNHQQCERSRVDLDTSTVFSDYDIFAQAQANNQEIYGTQPKGTFHDPLYDNRVSVNGGKRYRKFQKIADFVVNSQIYKSNNPQQVYANWIGQRMHGRAQVITVVVPGWLDSTGRLYRPNATIPVLLNYQNIFGGSKAAPTPLPMLIAEAVYAISPQGGSTTTLTLMDQTAFGVEPQSPAYGPDRNQLLSGITPQTGPGGLLGHI
jgi:prophage tail gpP-like protein